MKDEITINVEIKPTWNIIKDIQKKTIIYMDSKGKSKEVTEATMMCVTELIENAIKYGVEDPSSGNINFDLHADENCIEIRVRNGIRNEDDISSLVYHIEKIKNSDNPARLYTERLMELMENPKPGVSQLGLYRIAYEGEFKIDYVYEKNILTISAIRDI